MEKKKLTENEQKKEFLMEYQVAKRDVIRLEEQLEELRIGKMSPGCMIGDGMPHAHNPSDLSDYAAKVEEIGQKIIDARYRRVMVFQRVQQAIEEMDNEREKTLLTYRYLRGMKWERICIEMDYKWRQVHRIHSSALKNIKMA